MLNALAIALAAVGTTLITLRGLLPSLKTGQLLSARALGDYAVSVAEFHENLRAGNFVPVWAANLQHGFGEPYLQFRAPLQMYVTELFYLATGKPVVAINFTIIFFSTLAALSMGLLLREALGGLKLERRAWATGVGALGYGLSPFLQETVFVRGALNELAGLAILPFTALSLLRLAKSATTPRIALAGLAWAGLALSNSAFGLIGLMLFGIASLVYRKSLASPWRFGAAIVLGLACSSFQWAAALGELSLIKAPLLTTDTFHFARLDQLIVGVLAVAGFFAALWRLSLTDAARHPTRAQRKAMLALLAAGALAVYFSHRVSVSWYEAFSFLQQTSPTNWLAYFVFFGTALAAIVLALELAQPRHWAAIALLLASFGTVFAHSAALSEKRIEDLKSERQATLTTPRSVGALPRAPAAENELLAFKNGRGEFHCERKGPTRIECKVLAIRNATLVANILDYPGWQAKVDGVATALSREPVRGLPTFTVSPGKHVVELRLRNTPLRLGTKLLSMAALLATIALLFQDKIGEGKAMSPKRGKRLEA